MRFEVLGPLQVTDGAQRLPLGGSKQRKLLALLLAADNEAISVDRLVDEMWGDEPPPSAVHLVQVYVSRLRGLLAADGAPQIRRDGAGYVFKVAGTDLDSAQLERSVADAVASRPTEPAAAASKLAEAIGWYRGRPFAELADESPLLQAEAQRLEELYLRGRELLADLRFDLGLHSGLVPDMEDLTENYPFREVFWGQLMLALYRSGRQAEALRVYSRLRHQLGEELGIEPTPALRDLEDRILLQDPELLWEAPPPPSNLPARLTSFVGRSVEIAALSKLLETSRLVTLSGPGGIGKTRLAIEGAEQFVFRFPDGVWWIDLAPISDPELVAVEVASALGVAPQPGRLVADSIAGALARRELLLVLDNCEHVVESAAALIAHLLREAPRLRCLVTSRRPLRISGEALMVVPPLAIPAVEVELLADVRLADSVRLLVDRASSVDPAFDLADANAGAIVDICRRLDGVPLAIEMAAARTNVMSPAEIADSLGNRFALLVNPARDVDRRQATLAATLDWSYELLDEVAQRVFDRLAVFAGAFGIDDVASVAIESNDSSAALEAITGLVENSMCSRVSTDPARMQYRLLETPRAYGIRKLAERGELDEAREAHAAHFLELIATASEFLGTPELAPFIDRLQQSYEDVQRSLEWSLANHSRARTLATAPVLFRYWLRTGDAPGAGRWGSQMLQNSADVPDSLRAGALLCVGFANTILGDPAESIRCSTEACRIYREAGDSQALVTALFGHAQSFIQVGDLGSAAATCAEALELCDELGDSFGRADHLASLGLINLFIGDLDVARTYAEEALPIHRRLRDRAGLVVMNALPAIALKQGDLLAAERAAADLVADAAGTAWEASAMSQLGEALLAKGDHDGAATVTRRAIVKASASGLGNWFRIALRNLAQICARSGKPETAARLAGASHRDIPNFGLDPVIYGEIESLVAAAIGEERYTTLHDEGFRMSQSELLDFAATL